MVGEWVYHIAVLLWQNCITLNFGSLVITGVGDHVSNFPQNVRDGEQNLLWVINQIYNVLGEWFYHITFLLWQNCITLNFG